MADGCSDPRATVRNELDQIKQYAFNVWTHRPQPDTTYLANFQRLKKWPEPAELQVYNDRHYRHRPQPSKHFLKTMLAPLPSQRSADPTFPTRMPTLGSRIDGKPPHECHVPSAARTLSTLQWRRTTDDYAAAAALAADLAVIPPQHVRRTESFTHADMHRLHPIRGDFSIHPDWPPTINHHRIPYLHE